MSTTGAYERHLFHTVLHCHLAVAASTEAPLRDVDDELQSATLEHGDGKKKV